MAQATPSGERELLLAQMNTLAAHMTPGRLAQAREHPATVARAEAFVAGGYTLGEVLEQLGYANPARAN